jgi:RNA polymerase sigma-70 factor (ECF subfamily)
VPAPSPGNAVALAELDEGIVRKAQRGDREAFATIVREYELPIFNYVLRLVRQRELAEDLTQEVFLRVFHNLPSFSFRSKFTTWLFTVARYRVLDEVRARERRGTGVRHAEIEYADLVGVDDPPAEQGETIEALWRAVDGLNLDLKTALLLRDVSGFSYHEIAEIVGATLATVRWRIWKAREDVQLALAEEGLGPTKASVVGQAAAAPAC